MDDPRARPIPPILGYNCFACGTENEQGLKMRFYRVGDEVRSDVVLAPSFVGWENMAHGGVISSLLDEVMAWTIMVFRRSLCVTREIKVRYLKPVPVEAPLMVVGAIAPRERRRWLCRVNGRMLDASGVELARAEAEFALLREEQLGLLPERVRRDMAAFVAELEAGLLLGDDERQEP
jgi:acyl-coenzyme A thioesterase PaaI-like protein